MLKTTLIAHASMLIQSNKTTILTDPARTEAEKKRLLKQVKFSDDPRDISEYEDLPEEEKEQIDRRIFRQVLTSNPDKIAAEEKSDRKKKVTGE
jgi:hypothetical protein